jgi:hypothetical protein
MKKIILLLIAPYIIVMGIIFYFNFGVGVISGYAPFEWKGIKTRVPKNFNNETYPKNGCDVYYLQKKTVLIRIVVAPTTNNSQGFSQRTGKMLFDYSSEPGKTFYVSKTRKVFEALSVATLDDVSIFFDVTSPSAFTSVRVLEKITTGSSFNGKPIPFLHPPIPRRVFFEDILIWIIILAALAITLIVTHFSGKRPGIKYFLNDPIQFEEKYVYFSRKIKIGRNSSFGFMVLTSSRLLVFHFMKPIFELKLKEGKPNLRFEGKKIILENEKGKITIRSSNIDTWKEALFSYVAHNDR